MKTGIPLKLGQNVCHNHSALQSSVCEGVVFEQRKQVLALLHGQTSDQLLHNLQHKNTDQFVTAYWCNSTIGDDICCLLERMMCQYVGLCFCDVHLSSCGV